MSFFHKSIIDTLEWRPQGDEVIYAHHFPEVNISNYARLNVFESQEALFFSKGRLITKFGPGNHNLQTENLPILRDFMGLPYGGNNPFSADVWFVNMVQTFAIDWEISRMSIHDIDYDTQLQLVARGQYGLKVVDAEKFVMKFVGTKNDFTQDDMTNQSYGEFCSKAKSIILQYMLANKIGFKQISAYLDMIGTNLKSQMETFWSDLGLELTKFYVTSIDLDESTEEGRRIANAISRQASMKITGHTWQQEQAYGTANNAIESFQNMAGQGNSGGLLGGLIAVQMMSGMSNGMGGAMMQPAFNQPSMGGVGNSNAVQALNGAGENITNAHPIYCGNCSKKYMSNQAFCPHCGHKTNLCPKCGTDNSDKAKRCVSCGTNLLGNTGIGEAPKVCPNCGSALALGAVFCGNCGTKVCATDENRCQRCGAELQPNAKFCPACGNRR